MPIAQASPFLVYDQRIVNIDRGSAGLFAQSFIEFSTKMLPGGRIFCKASLRSRRNAATFARAEPAIRRNRAGGWIAGLLGTRERFRRPNMGKDQALLPRIVSLAYDCRRSDMFRGHLVRRVAADRAWPISRRPRMIGSWAGELGQTQMIAVGILQIRR